MHSNEVFKVKKNSTLKEFIKENTNINFQILNILIRKKKIKINNKVIKDLNTIIALDDEIAIFSLNNEKKTEKKLQISRELIFKIKSMIFYEDEKIIVLNKNIPISTQKEISSKPSLIDVIKKIYNNDEIRIVHRLDKSVTGLIAFAKNKEVAQEISNLFKNRKVTKEYILITDRNVKFEKIMCKEPIIEDNKKVESETEFEFLEKINNFNIVKCIPKTGRKHQIRKHASFLKIPILGDIMYGGSKNLSKNFKDKISLFSTKIKIPNYCDLCIDFYENIKELRENI